MMFRLALEERDGHRSVFFAGVLEIARDLGVRVLEWFEGFGVAAAAAAFAFILSLTPTPSMAQVIFIWSQLAHASHMFPNFLSGRTRHGTFNLVHLLHGWGWYRTECLKFVSFQHPFMYRTTYLPWRCDMGILAPFSRLREQISTTMLCRARMTHPCLYLQETPVIGHIGILV